MGTLPSASSFMQIQVTSKDMRSKALAALRQFTPKNARMELLALALEGKKVGFEKVIKMIDDMVASLKVEQKDDDAKKEYCGEELDLADDKKKSLEHAVADLETAIENDGGRDGCWSGRSHQSRGSCHCNLRKINGGKKKKKEVIALTKEIETRLTRIGD